MKTFTMYRREDISDTHDENQMNPPDEPQFQGIEFDNGKVAICWLTAASSVSIWDSMDDMLAIHGHPEYGSELVWVATEVTGDEFVFDKSPGDYSELETLIDELKAKDED